MQGRPQTCEWLFYKRATPLSQGSRRSKESGIPGLARRLL
jgi:hypothetical protein